MRAILFDLDGTLLPISMDDFETIYFNGLASQFSDWMPAKDFIDIVWQATFAMVYSQDDRTNETIFFDAFKPLIGEHRLHEAVVRFDHFYQNQFSELKRALKPVISWKPVLETLRAKGYVLVCATNPLFPQRATQQRLSWIGLDLHDFDVVTTFETSKACKPHLKYYQDIFDLIQVAPQQALMVGNDTLEDTIVSRLGAKTYLVIDHLKYNKHGYVAPTYEGSAQQCIDFLDQLPNLRST